MTSFASSLCCFKRQQPSRSDDAPPAASASPGILARLSGLATAARSSAQLGLAIGAAVTSGLATKAAYIAAMMAAGPTTNKTVSTGIVLAGTVVVQSGVGTLVEGARCLGRERPALTSEQVASVKALGVAAYLVAMLASAYRAMQDEDTQPLGAYMMAHAAGQVLSALVAEVMANRLVPHAVIPTELWDEGGQRIEPTSGQARALRSAAEIALIAGQVLAHVALMATLLDKIPLMQQRLGAPVAFRPGQDSPQDHLLAGLGVAAVVGGSEAGRVAAGGLAMALAQTLKGATIRAVPPRLREESESVTEVEMQPPAADTAPVAEEQPPAVSRWQECCDILDQAGHRIGLGADARGRFAGYAPILNLNVDALTTGPRSGLIQKMASTLDKPVFQVALGVSNFTLSLLNAADMLLLARRTPREVQTGEPAPGYGTFNTSLPLGDAAEAGDLDAADVPSGGELHEGAHDEAEPEEAIIHL